MSITLPISFEVVSMRGAAAAVTSTVSAKAPMLRVAEISVVFVACTITVSKTCALNPSFDTLNLYVPSGRLTNAYVPVAWVSAVIALLVPKLRSSKCAPGTILPLGSRTVTVTVPSVCCAQAQGRAINRTAERHEARLIRIEDTRDIRLPPANEVQHTKQPVIRPPIFNEQRQHPRRGARADSRRKHYGKRFLMAGFCILYSEWLSRYFLSKVVRFSTPPG